MPKMLIQGWVKNVYSLRTADGTNSAILPTGSYNTITFPYYPVYNSLVIPRFIPAFYALLSTYIFPTLHLLTNQLYLFSTPPITKRTKEN